MSMTHSRTAESASLTLVAERRGRPYRQPQYADFRHTLPVQVGFSAGCYEVLHVNLIERQCQ